MTQRLKTSTAHKIIVSPIGWLMENKLYERIKTQSVPNEFKLSRAAATARATVGGTVDEFLAELGGPTDVSQDMRDRLADGLAQFAQDWRAREEVVQRWRDVFWGDDEVPNDELVELERERREKSEPCIMPSDSLRFLFKADFVPSVKFDTPTPEEVFSTWADEIDEPDLLYGAPASVPQVEESQRVLGPSGVEYVVRFESPSLITGDTVYGRVFEPENASGPLPTLIYGGGLALPYDQIKYWPAEDYMARPVADRGCRVILIESPWHGRRALPGYYSGEPYLATAPEGLFQLYAAQAQETAILVDWARSLGAPAVAVGGISLGAIVAQLVAGHAGSWPASMRPDLVFLSATCNHIDRVITSGKMSELTGVDQTVRDAGWTEADLERLRGLLDPPSEPGIPPDRVVAVLGNRDSYMPYRWGREMLEEWGVPERNIVAWDAGHFGVLLRMFRKSDGQDLIVQNLKEL